VSGQPIPSSGVKKSKTKAALFLISDPLNGTDRLSRNVGKDLQLQAAKQTRGAEISSYPTYKHFGISGFENSYSSIHKVQGSISIVLTNIKTTK